MHAIINFSMVTTIQSRRRSEKLVGPHRIHLRGWGDPPQPVYRQILTIKTIPHQVPISECIYENSAKDYKCSPDDPGKETRIPFSLLPVVVVPIQTKKRVVYLRALLDTGSTASIITVSALSRIPSITIESDIPLTMCTIQGMSREPSTKLRVDLKINEGGLPVECYQGAAHNANRR